MTAQMSDSVLFLENEFSLAGVNGTKLFEPGTHGIKPADVWCSACWRGFRCTYHVNDVLTLARVHVMGFDEDDSRQAREGKGPLLFGRAPEIHYFEARSPDTGRVLKRYEMGFIYRDLQEVISFSGGLLIGKDFIEELYVHMGFHPAWKYREVHELIFADGHLTSASDRSAEMQQFRDEMQDRGPERPAGNKEVAAWIAKCFSLDYRW